LAEKDKTTDSVPAPAKKEEHKDKKARKLMVPIKWTKEEQEFITAMMFSFSGVFLTFVVIVLSCFLFRKNMKKPIIDQNSQFWASFVEDKKESPEAIWKKEQKGKAPLTKKNGANSMNKMDRDIELA